jgi:hypothetical protein
MEKAVNQKLQQEMKKIHQKQQQMSNLTKSQTTNINYPRVINCTNTQFTQEETQLLSKGMK